jgi:hypothetical protein
MPKLVVANQKVNDRNRNSDQKQNAQQDYSVHGKIPFSATLAQLRRLGSRVWASANVARMP